MLLPARNLFAPALTEMDTALGIALALASHIVLKVAQTKANNEDIQALAKYVRALKPLLESLVDSEVEASQGVQDLLLESLRKARDLVDDFAAMRSAVERFIRSGKIKDELATVRRVWGRCIQLSGAVVLKLSKTER